jgi:hypothetical protein
VSAELVEVRLVELPVRLHLQASQHLDELRRELSYVAVEPGSAPVRLGRLSARIDAEFGAFTDGPRQELRAAVAAGLPTVDVAFRLPRHAGEEAAAADAMLDEVEVFCREGGLLALAASAEVLAYRRWFFSEFTTQCAGEPPCPWSLWGAGDAATA